MATTRKTNPAATETAATTVAVDFKGETFDVPVSADWEFQALADLEDGRIASFLKSVLGTQYPTFLALKPKVGDLEGFVEALTAAQGIQGN